MKIQIIICALVCLYRVNSRCIESGLNWIPNPLNCNQFYLCLNGELVPYSCPDGSVAEVYSKSCVMKGSSQDRCSVKPNNMLPTTQKQVESTTLSTTTTAPITTRMTTAVTTTLAPTQKVVTTHKTVTLPKTICSSHGIFPVVNNCADYFECTSSLTATLKECPYPKLFNTENKRCEMPALVQCGDRYEPMDPCEYKENHCTKSHCVPCGIRYPSCRGLPDGLNPWSGREGSPYFAICRSQRVVFQGKCSYEENSDEQIFDSKLRVCVKASYHSK